MINRLFTCMPLPWIAAGGRLLFSKSWKAWLRAVENPARAQAESLLAIVRGNESTAFGREHGFAAIRNPDDFRKAVPVRGYAGLEPWIQRAVRGENAVIVSQPIRFFARTSGTTGTPKMIPVTEASLDEFRRVRKVWMRQVTQAMPGVARGRMLGIQSPARDGVTEGGVPYGSITAALSSGAMHRITAPFQHIPPEVWLEPEYPARYYALLRLSLQEQVSAIGAINPSTIVLICNKLTEHGPDLIRDLRDGTYHPAFQGRTGLGKLLAKRLRKAPAAAAAMERSLARQGVVRPGEVWPRLCGLLCWTGGSADFYLKQFDRWFDPLPIMDYGYAASEGTFSIPMSAGTPFAPIALHGAFLEFIPEEERLANPNAEFPNTCLAHELEPGRRYFAVITSANGLARYDINDVVEAGEPWSGAAQIVFRHKGAVLNITGEKITESQAVEAMTAALQQESLAANGFTLGLRLAEPPRYVFAFEPASPWDSNHAGDLLESCERELRRINVEYAAKRDSLRLGPPLLAILRTGAYAAHRAGLVSRGAPDAHVKPPHLARQGDLLQSLGIERELEWQG
ncbi:MAG: hypothetical protein GMKNLPBB_00923 [Myxococcota bacterium]|nr:hypothetical protein [Myxococcota bacterium]